MFAIKNFSAHQNVPVLQIAAFAFLLCVASVGANAQASKASAPDPVEVRLERKKVVVVDGKEALVSAATARPGDLIVETATYTNRSKKNFRVEATLPVPQYTEFVAGTASPNGVKASADGNAFGVLPLKRQQKKANGVVVEQVVPTGEYRALRWSAINLGPEKQFVASARFRLRDSAIETVAQNASK
jgi:hypothetical protein